MRNLLCLIGWHNHKFIFGTANEYYECTNCKNRMVKLAIGVYQPLDLEWLFDKKIFDEFNYSVPPKNNCTAKHN